MSTEESTVAKKRGSDDDELRVVSALRFTCDGCGGRLLLTEEGPVLECESCGSEQPIPRKIHGSVPDSPVGEASSVSPDDVLEGMLGECSGCGARFSSAHLVAQCHYCDAAVAACPDGTGVPRPHGVLPFRIDEARARAIAEAAMTELSPLRRLYLPCLVFACDAKVDYVGIRSEDRSPLPPEEFEVNGTMERPFDHRLVLATPVIPLGLCPDVESWDLGFVEPFDPRRLIGAECEHAHMDAAEAFATVTPGLAAELFDEVEHEHPGQEFRTDTVGTPEFTNERFRYVLLPAWVGVGRHSGELKHFLVHGRTGELFHGDTKAEEVDVPGVLTERKTKRIEFIIFGIFAVGLLIFALLKNAQGS